MSFGDQLREISTQTGHDKKVLETKQFIQLEQDWPHFLTLIYEHLKGLCVIAAQKQETSISCRLIDLFSSMISEGTLYDRVGNTRKMERDELWLLNRVRSVAGDNRLPEQYAQDFASQITARFQAEELHAEAVPVPFGGVHGMCFDVHLSIKWQRFNPSEEYKRRGLPV